MLRCSASDIARAAAAFSAACLGLLVLFRPFDRRQRARERTLLQLAEGIDDRDTARTALAALERNVTVARNELEQAQRAATTAENARRQLATERDNLAATAEDLRKQIAAAGQAPDRSGEIRQLGEQLAAVQRERGEAERPLRGARRHSVRVFGRRP